MLGRNSYPLKRSCVYLGSYKVQSVRSSLCSDLLDYGTHCSEAWIGLEAREQELLVHGTERDRV